MLVLFSLQATAVDRCAAEACLGTFVTLKGACGKTTTTNLGAHFMILTFFDNINF